jgi:hypothetical protein
MPTRLTLTPSWTLAPSPAWPSRRSARKWRLGVRDILGEEGCEEICNHLLDHLGMKQSRD